MIPVLGMAMIVPIVILIIAGIVVVLPIAYLAVMSIPASLLMVIVDTARLFMETGSGKAVTLVT